MLKSDYEINQIHIGNLIKQVVDSKDITYQEFADKLNCERSSIYYLFRCKSIDIDKLIKVSNVLNYNFVENVYVVGGKSDCGKKGSNGHSAVLINLTDDQANALKKVSVKQIPASELKDLL